MKTEGGQAKSDVQTTAQYEVVLNGPEGTVS